MYPFLAWSYESLVERLSQLLDSGFDIEAIVASVQTLEQGFKRPLVRQMNTGALGFSNRRALDRLVPLTTISDRNRSVRALQGLQSIDQAWCTLIAADRSDLRLPALVDRVVGVGAWTLLVENAPVPQPMINGHLAPGLFGLRHQLVHGWHLPSKDAIGRLAPMGPKMVAAILHPRSGIGTAIGYDPFHRMPRFRPRPST